MAVIVAIVLIIVVTGITALVAMIGTIVTKELVLVFGAFIKISTLAATFANERAFVQTFLTERTTVKLVTVILAKTVAAIAADSRQLIEAIAAIVAVVKDVTIKIAESFPAFLTFERVFVKASLTIQFTGNLNTLSGVSAIGASRGAVFAIINSIDGQDGFFAKQAGHVRLLIVVCYTVSIPHFKEKVK